MARGTEGMSELELAILTPDERAALEEESTTEETVARASQASGPMPGEEKDDENDIVVTAKAPAAAGDAEVIEAAPPTAPKADAPAPETPTDPAAGQPEPFVARMPTAEAVDYTAQLADLAQKFEDGDLSTAEYNAQLTELIAAKTKAELSAEFNQNLEVQLWERAKAAFFNGHEQYKNSRPLFGALSAEISAIETERIDKQLPPLSGPDLLEEAHKNVMREFGQVPPSAKATSRAGQPPDLTKVPTTLAHVPPAAEPDTGKDRFAELDRLADTDPMEWERQLARLSPSDAAAYLASA